MAKTIHTVLYDDVLDGSKIVTMDNCVCQLYDIKRDYDATKINVVSLTGIPYMQTPGQAVHRRITNVYCDTYEKRDALDNASNEGALVVIDWGGQIFRGYIEDKKISWRLDRNECGVARFTMVVKEVVDE